MKGIVSSFFLFLDLFVGFILFFALCLFMCLFQCFLQSKYAFYKSLHIILCFQSFSFSFHAFRFFLLCFFILLAGFLYRVYFFINKKTSYLKKTTKVMHMFFSFPYNLFQFFNLLRFSRLQGGDGGKKMLIVTSSWNFFCLGFVRFTN